MVLANAPQGMGLIVYVVLCVSRATQAHYPTTTIAQSHPPLSFLAGHSLGPMAIGQEMGIYALSTLLSYPYLLFRSGSYIGLCLCVDTHIFIISHTPSNGDSLLFTGADLGLGLSWLSATPHIWLLAGLGILSLFLARIWPFRHV